MICASSSTRMPDSGPGWGWARASNRATLRGGDVPFAPSAPRELGLAWRETPRSRSESPRCRSSRSTRPCSAAEIGARIGEAARELLVPACDQRCTLGDPSRGRARLGTRPGRRGRRASPGPCSIASAASKIRPSSRISSATLEPTRRTSGAISAYAMTRPRFLIGAPKRLDLAADPQVAQRGDLEPAADADAVDLRDQRVTGIRRARAPSRA